LENASAKNFQGLVPLIKEEFPEVSASTRIDKLSANAGIPVMYDEKIFSMSSVSFVDSTFFNVFPSLLKRGTPKTCLSNEHSVIFSEALSRKIFGAEDPIGKSVVLLQNNSEYVVTGVMTDIPDNAHFRMEMVIPFDYSWDLKEYHFQTPDRHTYITMPANADTKSFERRLNARVLEQQKDNSALKGVRLSLQRLKDIHLSSNMADEFEPNSNKYVLNLLGFAVFILLLTAFVNTVNLETAQLIKRIKSIGVRGILGSTRKDLFFQFLREYSAIIMVAIVIAIAMTVFFSRQVNFISSITKMPFSLEHSWVWISVVSILVLGTLITSLYPFLLLADFKPANWLKGQLNSVGRGANARGFFIVFQFVSSIVLIALVFITSGQLRLMFSANKGMDIGNVVSIYNALNYTRMEDSLRYENYTNFKNTLLQNPAISAVTSSSAIPGMEIGFTYVNSVKKTMDDSFNPTAFKLLYVDYDFIPLFDLKLVEGRNYSLSRGEDQNWESIILNEAAVKALGFTRETALDQYIYFQQAVKWEKLKIVGIVNDYRQESFKSPLYPTIFYLHQYKGQQAYYSIKYNSRNSTTEALAGIKDAWDKVWPSKPFDYFFLDDFYGRQYKAEVELRNTFYLFAGATLIIACLGILGISLFETKFRMKEIAVRMIHGASIGNLLLLLLKNILRLLLVAFLISCPAIYLLGTEWLSYYSLKIEMTPWFFVAPLAIVLPIVASISGVQVFRAIQTRPVKTLRSE
jgi:putative ABC transport system permease protein